MWRSSHPPLSVLGRLPRCADQSARTQTATSPSRHRRLGAQSAQSGRLLRDRPRASSPRITAGVCAPAVKDFATVRNRSAHTTEDAQPRSQTVMTCSEPSPQTWKACWRQPLTSSDLPSSAACGCEWITWCSIEVWSTTLADLPTCSDSSRRSCRTQMVCQRSGPCLARARPRVTPPGPWHDCRKLRGTDRSSPRYRCR